MIDHDSKTVFYIECFFEGLEKPYKMTGFLTKCYEMYLLQHHIFLTKSGA